MGATAWSATKSRARSGAWRPNIDEQCLTAGIMGPIPRLQNAKGNQ